ncbi:MULTISPECIES: patatin-like phospholipase family protein [unclassified Oleiphilus]|uniref:patatin-like phospholipase family protein n=2 Tax=Oleiphilus TaxID=141450 RepID=UPI0018D2969D|nr:MULTISPECIES: patatin-like phospholipase family protein [unclassified Oleiphilus]
MTSWSTLAASTNNEPAKSAACQSAVDRPCIGLVLAGGGARGSAHVGVLQALEEREIPIDLIVGTSMGSFVGGLYSSGKSAAEIEQLFIKANWNSGYVDDLPRSRIPNRRKRHDDLYPIQLGIGFDADGFKLPKGIFQGQGMRRLIESMLGSYPVLKSFDDLSVSYRAVAADLETGEQIVLDRGDLATAMQASMSLPGILRPIEIDGRVLVDGGIANNLPVSVAKDLGADIVIAVDIGSLPLPAKDIDNTFDVLGQLSNFLTFENQQRARALLSEADLLIKPNLDGITLTDFSSTEKGIQAGYAAANVQSDKLQSIAQNYTSKHVVDQPELAHLNHNIDSIILNNKTRLADDYIFYRMRLSHEGPYTKRQIREGIERLYGQGTIARVTTFVEESNEQSTMKILIEEKEWGPGYLDFLFSFEDNFRSFSLFEIGAAMRLTNLSPYGAEWTNSVQFGSEKVLKTDLYWPIYTSSFFLLADSEYKREISNYFDSSGDSVGEVINSSNTTKAGFGFEFNDSFDMIAAAEIQNGDIELPDTLSSQIGLDVIDYDSDSILIRAEYDTLDEADFSRSGSKLDIALRRSATQALGLPEEYANKFEVDLSVAGSLGAHTLKPTLRFGNAYNEGPIGFTNFELGGFLNLSGLDRDFLSGPFLRFARLVYTYELAKNPMGGTNLPFYLGISAEAGNVWEERSAISWDSTFKSGAAFFGWDSPIGPAFLGYGRTNTQDESFYISLGKRF